ncbi:MAG: 1,4-alpha-glucan branching protein GlgB [bacterium]|nr:1,4-alpha-glucan branching protein GlgB [bacterium]
MNPTLSETDLYQILEGTHHDPFQVLGMHAVHTPEGLSIAIRAFLPEAQSVCVQGDGAEQEMNRIHPDGFFEAVFPDQKEPFSYRLTATDASGQSRQLVDPYAFPPFLSDYDLHLFAEGNHHHIYDRLGAHPFTHQGISGIAFSVWAPASERVSVVGDFNQWDGRVHPMRSRGSSGVWELFIPGLQPGALYKFEIRSQDGATFPKSDPYAFRMEHRPQTAGVIHSLNEAIWTDQDWLDRRSQADLLRSPMSIYEVHPGAWRRIPEENNRPPTYRELAHDLVAYVKEMGYTHIELMPVMEHPLDESWGYQITGYFAPTSRYGTPEDFQYFVNHCHNNDISVILDWVPAHFPTDAHGLATFDGTALYEHADPRQGAHPDWGTLIFNYGRNEVKNFLIANALFWFEKYHIDGLRVDAVASMLYLDYSRPADAWVPNSFGGRENLEAIAFMKTLNEAVHAQFPGVLMVAEESTSWPGVSRPTYLGGLGFGFKWNMGWMNDVLDFMEKDPIHRKFHQDSLTFGLLYAFHENFILVLSHDEVVHGKRSLLDKMPGDVWQKFANLRLFYGYMFGHPGKKLLFMGSEFGQWREWDALNSLDWHLLEHEDHRQLQRFVKDLNRFYTSHPALYESDSDPAGFEWIDFHDTNQGVLAFLRRPFEGGPPVVFVYNFTPVPRMGYRVGVPSPGYYRETLNSDADLYGGSNLGNLGGLPADEIPWQGQSCSIQITLPPLAVVAFDWDPA